MPFVIRKVEPRYVCRGHVPQSGNSADCWPVGAEMEAVANGALTASLKQLASLLATAEDIFADLTGELTSVADRSGLLRRRLDKLEERLGTVDPKKIPVPESDISTFASRTVHFRASNKPDKGLFTSIGRPKALRELYEAAGIVAVRSLDSLRRDRDAGSSMDMFMCTPVLGKRRRDKSLDIESRVPAALDDLRRWTSTEALGDVTVAPDCMSRILGDTATDDAVDHKLPSPEEQVQAVALKFPAEIVAVDVSGRGFERMSMRRRSLLAGPESQDSTAVKRRSRPRRPRGKRRNTIAGTDHKEIRQAVGGEAMPDDPEEILSSTTPRAHRSASTDILGSCSKKESSTEKKSHFNTLKAWGMSRLKLISPRSSQSSSQHIDVIGDVGQSGDEINTDEQAKTPDETNIYETVSMRRRKDKSHERKPSSSSSSGKSTSSIPVSVPNTERQSSVKLRESAAQRRERRKGTNRDDAPHSSSGNWSASSESGRASIGSETTTTTHPPRSTTTASIGTSSTSLCHVRRLKGRDTSASSSVTSEGTLTPDIIQDITVVPFSDDGETSSVYSCDTEGYYTSFHMDSGLKTLREEEPAPQSPITKSSEVSSDPTSPIVENEYELFGRGSTSTTTSSAGTVCTALLAPVPPERKSSLTVVAMVHGQNGGESPDSGHNTSSSPVESASSPACTGRSCSEFEYSESSDLEGCDRIERIRSKTAINTSRIPSMCVITPPGSDDENAKDGEQESRRNDNNLDSRSPGSVLMSATVGTSKMEVINGQDKNLYATVQTVVPSNNPKISNDNCSKTPSNNQNVSNHPTTKISPLSGVLGKLRGVLPLAGRKHASKNAVQDIPHGIADSGDYVTIADVRNNNDKRHETANATTTASLRSQATYANSDLFRMDAEYVSLSELPKKPDSSLERRRQGARVTLDSEGKVVYSSDSLKRRKGAHTTFNPGPFVKEGISPMPSPLSHRAQTHVRAVTKTTDAVDGHSTSEAILPTSPQLGKLIIRAAKSPDRAPSPDYVRTPTTVVGPTSPTSPHRQVRGAYVNVQGDEDNVLLPHQTEAAPSQISSQPPPPYVGPPQPQDWQKVQRTGVHVDDSGNSQNKISVDDYTGDRRLYDNRGGCYGQSQNRQYQPDLRSDDRTNLQIVDNSHQYYEPTRYNDNPRIYGRQTLNPPNSKNQQFCSIPRDANQQFYTLPTRRPQREVEPPRSVTPDITRGLGRGPLSAMHMLAKHGKKPIVDNGHGRNTDGFVDLNRREFEQIQGRCRLVQNQQQQPLVDVRNRFVAPIGLSALGYRFFASSPVQDAEKKSSDTLRHPTMSPIASGNSCAGLRTSTPSVRSNPTVAERLTMIGNNCSSPIPGSSGRSTPTLHSSGRNTPTNLVLSPTKSTMSNEELFAAIHKSKRRLNIRDDADSLSPASSTGSLVKIQAGTRHSWSPESQKAPEIPPTVQSPSATSRLDFKRLLLQQSVKTGPIRLSAAEQLKLSRQQVHQQQQQQHQQQQQQQQQHYQHQQQYHYHQQLAQNVVQVPLAKVLSPRSVWRFQTPRTDVLSSTIIEDAAAEEKAMKPSPENPPPSSRLNSRRQLDLRDNVPERLAQNDAHNVQVRNNDVTSRARDNNGVVIVNDRISQISGSNRTSIVSRTPCVTSSPQNLLSVQRVSVPYSQNIPCTIRTNHQQQQTLQQVGPRNIPRSQSTPATNFESRRINNQLARAQFLAATPTDNDNQNQSAYFQKRFRARSESPQSSVTRSVARSPSAPTLETAL